MNPFGRLRWFLGRLISPARTNVSGSAPAPAEADIDRPAEENDDEE